MCNAYFVRPKLDTKSVFESLTAEDQRLESPLVRRTGPGVILVPKGADLEPQAMRWGCDRPWSKAINNARSNNFESSVWAEALRSRRCSVPISSYFEWQHLPGGSKQAHEILRPDGDWMWVTGRYEPSEPHGPCYRHYHHRAHVGGGGDPRPHARRFGLRAGPSVSPRRSRNEIGRAHV